METRQLTRAFFFLISIFFLFAESAIAAEVCTPYSYEYTSGTSTEMVSGEKAKVVTKSLVWAPEFVNSSWVWGSEVVQKPQEGETETFFQKFTLPSGNSTSTLEIAADDYFKVYLNDSEVASEFGEGNFLLGNIHTYTNLVLKSGENTLKFEVVNAPYFYANEGTPTNNPAGLLYRLSVQGTTCVTQNNTTTNNIPGANNGGSGGGGVISGPLSYGYQKPAIVENVVPAVSVEGSTTTRSVVVNTSTTTVSQHVVAGDLLAGVENEVNVASSSTQVVASSTEQNNNESQLAFAGVFDLNTKCTLIGLLLALIVFVVWKLLGRLFHSNLEKKTNNEIVKLEVAFYVVALVVVVAYLVMTNEICALVPFVLAVLILIVFKFNKMLRS